MAAVRITKRTVDGAAATGAEFFVWDAELVGFGLRVRETGAKSFIVRYRAGTGRNAPTRRVTIGPVGKLTPEEARKAAKAILADAVQGKDRAAERARERADITVAELADRYLAEGCDKKKPSTVLNDRSRITRHVKPLLGTKRVGAVNSSDIARAIRDVANGKTALDERTGRRGRAIVTGGRGAANQVAALLSSIFGFAVAEKLRTDNPATGVKKFKSEASERFLTTEELDRLGAAIRQAETVGVEWTPDPDKLVKHAPKPENRRTTISPHVAAALRLLILTGARLREILHLEWTNVDLERGLLFLADSKTGKKTIVLNAPALAILAELPRVGRYVVASESGGTKDEKPRADLAKPWRLVSKAAGLEGVRLHDLRHSFASVGAGAGLGLPLLGKLLGHSQASTTQRYAHLDADPLRKAADRIGAEIARAMGDDGRSGDGAEIVPLQRGRGA